jgi:hypothetical protein
MKLHYLFLFLVISACATETAPKQAATEIEEQRYVIEENDYTTKTYEIIEGNPEPSDSEQDNFERDRLNRERLDYEKSMKYTPTFAEKEEVRIEAYCKEFGFEGCMKIDRACEEDGCHKVSINCDDSSYDDDELDSCRRFDIHVDEKIDRALTKLEESDILEDGKDEP